MGAILSADLSSAVQVQVLACTGTGTLKTVVVREGPASFIMGETLGEVCRTPVLHGLTIVLLQSPSRSLVMQERHE